MNLSFKAILILFALILVSTAPVLGAGRPKDCDDTAYQAHPGYNENQALWDRYTAETDGVCQTRYGTGTPSSPCAHTVQVSVQGNPYYLCWYNEDDVISGVSSLPQGFNYQGREYYVVTSTDPNADTGDEVCTAVSRQCVGYTVEGSEVCEHYHPDARLFSSQHGDKSGVFCDGSPQSGICATRGNTCLTCPECTNTVDCSTPIGGLYREMYVECSGGPLSFLTGFFSAFSSFFSQLFSNIFSMFNQNQTMISTRVITVQIGPYPGKWGCEFFQIPFPGVNKKYVSCPYETPGAAINDAANAFCRQVMSSPQATAEVCDENGVIVCTHPCETTPPHIIPDRCAFDNDRQRGSQAPPLIWCLPEETTPVEPVISGRPRDCDDTAYQAHPGYNENQALWDRYTAETDRVCQSVYGRGIPSGCEYIVQVSRAGNPYYLCWYNNK